MKSNSRYSARGEGGKEKELRSEMTYQSVHARHANVDRNSW
jgi:hypothetical protein